MFEKQGKNPFCVFGEKACFLSPPPKLFLLTKFLIYKPKKIVSKKKGISPKFPMQFLNKKKKARNEVIFKKGQILNLICLFFLDNPKFPTLFFVKK